MTPLNIFHRITVSGILALCTLSAQLRADTPPPSSEPTAAAPAAAPDLKEGTPSDTTATAPTEGEPLSAQPAAKSDEPDLKPRFRMQMPSLHQAMAELLRSHSGTLVHEIAGIMLDSVTRSADGLDHDETIALIDAVRAWPDTSADLCTFAPDIQGRSRWAVRLDWPLSDLRDRMQSLLASPAARDMLEGVKLRDEDGVAVIRLRGEVLGYLLVTSDSRSMFATHADLILPTDKLKSVGKEGASAPLLTARLNLAGTEKDSGATAFSSFSVITALTYSGYVDADGVWREQLDILWPPISGMGLKALIGKVKQTFFVPGAAIGALALNAAPLPGILDQLAGFGPTMDHAEPEADELDDDSADDEDFFLGPLTMHGNSELAVVVLPGTGFLPAPDFVIQSRLKKKDAAITDLRKAVTDLNHAATRRESREEWSEISVNGLPVFWRDSAANARGMLPFAMKSVVFTTSERDARDFEKDFLVLAFTSTSPENLVRRWLAFPRTKDKRYVPIDSKSSGELWLNWKSIYTLVHPYLDLLLNVGSSGALLPHADRLSNHLTPGRVTAQVKYAGLNIMHEGPMPVGVLALPLMFGVSLEPDTSGASDLAREQYAVQRLQVLHHHAELFRKDLNRWPAELRELDGYVDFRAHPELLRLHVSSSKAWGDWFSSLSEDEEKKDDEDDAADTEFDTKLYVINWKKDAWSLGYAPETFEHLQTLSIDQDGKIHRVPAPRKPAEVKPAAETKSDDIAKEEAPPEPSDEGDEPSPKE